MINNQAHKLCAWLALKARISVSIQETASQLTDELHNKVTVKNTDYQDQEEWDNSYSSST